jgi:hypothetical protein
MGAINFSVDPQMIAVLKQNLPLQTFVETGTFEGETVQRVLSLFDEIHSVELSEDYYRKALDRFKDHPNVHIYQGNSPDFLQKLRRGLSEKAVVYWLDAHWCIADKSAGGTSQCPLLQELDAITELGPQSAILIDDARLFLCPPPFPHEATHWPSFEAVVGKLHSLSSAHEIMIANDVIMFYPRSIRDSVREYAYRSSIDWLQVLFKSKNFDALKSEFDTLQIQFDSIQDQLVEKDKEITRLLTVAEERYHEIESLKEIAEERSREIQSIKGIAEERSREIQSIKDVAEERSRVIRLINEELETIKRHWAYRTAAQIKRILEKIRLKASS